MTTKDEGGSMFSYERAFSRNIGWVAGHEQEILRNTRVAIAGLGGVGGVHLLALTRLGVAQFNIADFDRFDLPNFNRQAGASMSTCGLAKIDVMAAQARDINPEVRIRQFPDGVAEHNIGEFLGGCDVYVDGLDFFAFDARALVFRACREAGIPALTVAPIGMGAALLNFLPGGMSFERYFDWGNHSDEEKALRFALGLAPAGLHRRYLVDTSALDLAGRRAPSTGMACQLCAGIAATEVLKLRLRRGTVLSAPHGMQFDAYRCKFARTWLPGGNRHPLQRLALAIGRRQLAAIKRAATAAPPA
jgi:molybdopterin/thiamine biosynthesis adenylyltransferase